MQDRESRDSQFQGYIESETVGMKSGTINGIWFGGFISECYKGILNFLSGGH